METDEKLKLHIMFTSYTSHPLNPTIDVNFFTPSACGLQRKRALLTRHQVANPRVERLCPSVQYGLRLKWIVLDRDEQVLELGCN